MGFGWLLIGYFFANVMSLYSPLSFAMLAGYPMMIMGLYHLAPYHPRFRYTFYASFVSLPLAIYFALYGFSQMGFGYFPFFTGTFYTVMEWCYFAFSLLFHALFLFAVAGLTRELGLIALEGNAWRNLIFVGTYYLLDGIARMPIPWIMAHQGYFSLSLILLRICFILLNIYLIYKCYRYICPEGEENMPDKLSQKSKKQKREKEDKK
ncbi:MAG: hypothetical protein IJX39_05135 [Clostridia bacterium]|nr:hypothetical protein [Clostridia bacterium]